MTADPISKIVACNLCTGCGGCAGAFPDFIKMVDDPEHGRRPVVDETAEGKRAAIKAASYCAGGGTDWSTLSLRDKIDEAWGPVLATWEGWASETEVRDRGSSGGAVTAFSQFALTSEVASGIAHVAAKADDPRLIEAVISRNKRDLMRGAGSRYAQASPAEAVGEIARGSERIAFVGKPCDVASVSKAMAADPQLAAKIPLTIAIFCAGAPNLLATQSLLDRLGVPKNARLTDLRYRGKGWPGLMQAEWEDSAGVRFVSKGISYAEGWGNILQSSRRWRCRVCADHTGVFADISVGDPWHTPPNGDMDEGRSLIVARTERGRSFVEAAIAAGVLVAEARTRDVIDRAQPNLSATQGAVWGRRVAMRVLGMPAPVDRGQHLFKLWLNLPFKDKGQSVLGAWKRVFRERLWRPVIVAERNL
jgi:coenzyme F420 hydrogenase subunit beta